MTIAPEDDPRVAFGRLFDGGVTGTTGGSSGNEAEASRRRRILDASFADLMDLRARLGDDEKSKLDLHFEALSEVEGRILDLEAPAERVRHEAAREVPRERDRAAEQHL